jgi:hypothetical protein
MNKILHINPIYRDYNLNPKRNSWEEFIMLSLILSQVKRSIDNENKMKIKLMKNRKRKRSESESESENSDEDASLDDMKREIKRLKRIENKLKRKYDEYIYG